MAGASPTTPPGHRGVAVAAPPGTGHPARALRRAQILKVALAASVAAGGAMAATAMFIGEVSSEPTAVPGIESSTWTPLTGIAAFLFGLDAFHGSFHVLPILVGLAVHLVFSVVFGVTGVVLIVATQGSRPGLVGAAVQGLVYALFVEVFFLNLVVNGIQDVLTVYESIPEWGWWVAHAAFGLTLGLVASRRFARAGEG